MTQQVRQTRLAQRVFVRDQINRKPAGVLAIKVLTHQQPSNKKDVCKAGLLDRGLFVFLNAGFFPGGQCLGDKILCVQQ